jgi:hypothetical protein
MLRMFRQINGKQRKFFPDGKEYLLDLENNNEPAEFETIEDIINLFKSEGHDVNTPQDLVNMGVCVESVDE